MPQQIFLTWLDDWRDKIEEVQLFSKSPLPDDVTSIQEDLNKTIVAKARLAELLADVEQHLTQCRAYETLQIRKEPEFDDYGAPERKVVVESRLAHITRTRDLLRASLGALNDRSYHLMGQRAFEREALRLVGQQEG